MVAVIGRLAVVAGILIAAGITLPPSAVACNCPTGDVAILFGGEANYLGGFYRDSEIVVEAVPVGVTCQQKQSGKVCHWTVNVIHAWSNNLSTEAPIPRTLEFDQFVDACGGDLHIEPGSAYVLFLGGSYRERTLRLRECSPSRPVSALSNAAQSEFADWHALPIAAGSVCGASLAGLLPLAACLIGSVVAVRRRRHSSPVHTPAR